MLVAKNVHQVEHLVCLTYNIIFDPILHLTKYNYLDFFLTHDQLLPPLHSTINYFAVNQQLHIIFILQYIYFLETSLKKQTN